MVGANTQNWHIVAIVADDGSYTIVDGQLLAKEGEKVTFLNLTTETLTIRFSNRNPFEEEVGKIKSGVVNEVPMRIQEGVNPGIYPYTIHGDDGKEYKEAHASMPRVIVYRRLA